MRLLLVAAAVPLLLFVLTAAAIVLDGLHDEVGRADVVVVLGNTVHPDGSPSARLRARLDKAIEVHREGRAAIIIVSGGLGKEGHDEAAVMRGYCIERGVPPDRVHADGAGTTTLETARNAERYMAERGLHRAIAVSQYFHVPRAREALRRAGIPEVYGVHAEHLEWRDLYATAREVLATYAYLLRS